MCARDASAFDNKRNHFHQLVASVEDYAIFTLDGEGRILDWNRGAERIKSYTPQEIVGNHFSVFYSEMDRAAGVPDEELKIARREGRFADEGWRFRKDGSRFWASVTITAIRHDGMEIEGFLKITRDLTERLLATETLRQSEERFRLLLESVKDYAIFMLDPEGHVISWNAGARRIKGYEEKEIVGRHFSVFYPEELLSNQVPETLMRRALHEGTAEHEGWRVRKDGTLFWGNVRITAIYDSSGELRGFTKVTHDLTERREVEMLKEQGRRKDAFLATLAHELRNPLAPILPGLDIVLAAPQRTEVVVEISEMLKRQVEQMAHLIDDLLDMSRITTGKIVLRKSRVALADVIRSAVETVNPAIEEFHHHLVVKLPERRCEIDVDPHRISQVISNLLSNAAKYTPPGGKIILEASVEAGRMLRISVMDNGKGISAELQEKVFDLFDQGENGSSDGLGIGLTLVKNLVEKHGGTVTLISGGDGRGSDFILNLPVVAEGQEITSPAPRAVSPAQSATDSGRVSAPRVLVADDGKSAADIMAMFFEMQGLETAVAYDGAEAVETARTFSPDLVCMDLGMPKMDGFEAAREIRQMQPDAILVAISGWGGDDDRRRSANAGFDIHLVKPVKPDDLREVLTSFFPKA